jgi:hypothetical protein
MTSKRLKIVGCCTYERSATSAQSYDLTLSSVLPKLSGVLAGGKVSKNAKVEFSIWM